MKPLAIAALVAAFLGAVSGAARSGELGRTAERPASADVHVH